jgi:hypothetical protein
MTAVDNDAGDNGRVDFSTVYISSQPATFGVRTSSTNPKVAELYTLVSFDREQSATAFAYNGSVITTVRTFYSMTLHALGLGLFDSCKALRIVCSNYCDNAK